MINPLVPLLNSKRAIILDGALATELERRGADLRDPLWSAKLLLENPNLIRQVHRDYFAAGADIATTASYQATISGLVTRGLTREQAADLLRLSVRLAQQARDDVGGTGLVAASIGCYGAFLHDGSEYRGDYGMTRQQLIDWHRPRFEILANSGADLLACETVPSLLEAEALAKLLGESSPIPAWISFSCQDDERLCHGEPFVEAIQLANEAPSIVAAGVNCTAPRFIDGLLARAKGVAHKPLIVYPNSGETWDAEHHCWLGTTSEPDWTACVPRWYATGARLIGGCCRTTPVTIRQMADAARHL
jgi:homocysteine S-methyltransferase